MEHHGLLEDVYVWYSISVVACVLVLFLFAKKAVLGFLDSEIAKIRHNLEESKKLREEALIALEDYKAKQAEAMKEADQIVERAKVEAEELRKKAEAEIERVLALHEQKAKDQIAYAEKEALKEIEAVVIDKALQAARTALAKKLDDEASKKIADSAIEEVSKVSLLRGNRA